MNFLWTSYELLMNILWTSYELFMNFLWTSYKLFTHFLWASCKLLINFLQISYKNSYECLTNNLQTSFKLLLNQTNTLQMSFNVLKISYNFFSIISELLWTKVIRTNTICSKLLTIIIWICVPYHKSKPVFKIRFKLQRHPLPKQSS